MKRKTTDALEIMDNIIGDDAELRTMVEVAYLNQRVAELIYNARVAAGLTQKELAGLVGTGQSAIARLEDAEYQGHSLNMLKRVARALKYTVSLDLVPLAGTAQSSELLQPPATSANRGRKHAIAASPV